MSPVSRRRRLVWIGFILVAVLGATVSGLAIARSRHDGGTTTNLISRVDPEAYTVVTHERVSRGGVIDDADAAQDLVPDGIFRVGAFVVGVRYFRDHFAQVSTVEACGYIEESYATATFRHRRQDMWAGFQVVVPGHLTDVMTTTSPCFLGARVTPSVVPVSYRLKEPGAGAAICDVVPTSDGGRPYTVITMGSSLTVCRDLIGRAYPTGPIMAKTLGDGKGRTEPRANAPVNLFVKPGTASEVRCYLEGQDGKLWDLVLFPVGTFDAITQTTTDTATSSYIPDADVDTGGDITGQVRPCNQYDKASAPRLSLAVGDIIVPDRTDRCGQPYRFDIGVTVNYKPAELTVRWQVGQEQATEKITFTEPGTKIATTSLRPVQNGTTAVTVFIADPNRLLSQERTLARPIELHC